MTRAGSSEPVPEVHVHAFHDERAHAKGVAGLRVVFCVARRYRSLLRKMGRWIQRFIQQVMDAAANRGVARVDPVREYRSHAASILEPQELHGDYGCCGAIPSGNLPPGRYSIDGGRDDYFDAQGADAIVVSGKTADVALSMIPGATVSGRVRNPAGRPLSNATVTALRVVLSKRVFPFSARPKKQPRTTAATIGYSGSRQANTTSGRRRIRHCRRVRLPISSTLSRVDQMVRTYYPGETDALAARELKIRGGEHISGIDIGMRTHPGVHRISGVITQFLQNRHGQCRTRSSGFDNSI